MKKATIFCLIIISLHFGQFLVMVLRDIDLLNLGVYITQLAGFKANVRAFIHIISDCL